jgi:surfactin synthase thioesterase subunit
MEINVKVGIITEWVFDPSFEDKLIKELMDRFEEPVAQLLVRNQPQVVNFMHRRYCSILLTGIVEDYRLMLMATYEKDIPLPIDVQVFVGKADSDFIKEAGQRIAKMFAGAIPLRCN